MKDISSRVVSEENVHDCPWCCFLSLYKEMTQ